MIKTNILLLEDDTLFANSLQDFLDECDFCVDLAQNIDEALNLSYKCNYDLYILDINLPDGNGIEFLKTLRTSQDSTPAIFLTSYKDKETKYKGFTEGCDDFLNKPVDLDELLLRINAILKRIGRVKSTIKLGNNFTYDLYNKSLFNDNERIILTPKLATLLDILIQTKGELVTKEIIISKLWSSGEEYSEGSIRVYINQIKKLLGENSIKNYKGLGYTLEK
jgi:DNA-binding response OmpR family regulator